MKFLVWLLMLSSAVIICSGSPPDWEIVSPLTNTFEDLLRAVITPEVFVFQEYSYESLDDLSYLLYTTPDFPYSFNRSPGFVTLPDNSTIKIDWLHLCGTNPISTTILGTAGIDLGTAREYILVSGSYNPTTDTWTYEFVSYIPSATNMACSESTIVLSSGEKLYYSSFSGDSITWIEETTINWSNADPYYLENSAAFMVLESRDIYYSQDGVTWSKSTLVDSNGNLPRNVFFNDAASNGINIIACGDGGVYAGTSLNYLQQTSRISMYQVIWSTDDNIFLGLGNSNEDRDVLFLFSSHDGVTWTNVWRFPIYWSLSGIINIGNGQGVGIFGDNGFLMTATNTSMQDSHFYGLSSSQYSKPFYGNGEFLFFDVANNVWQSNDPLSFDSWNSTNKLNSNPFFYEVNANQDIEWYDSLGLFILFEPHRMLASEDCVNWFPVLDSHTFTYLHNEPRLTYAYLLISYTVSNDYVVVVAAEQAPSTTIESYLNLIVPVSSLINPSPNLVDEWVVSYNETTLQFYSIAYNSATNQYMATTLQSSLLYSDSITQPVWSAVNGVSLNSKILTSNSYVLSLVGTYAIQYCPISEFTNAANWSLTSFEFDVTQFVVYEDWMFTYGYKTTAPYDGMTYYGYYSITTDPSTWPTYYQSQAANTYDDISFTLGNGPQSDICIVGTGGVGLLLSSCLSE